MCPWAHCVRTLMRSQDANVTAVVLPPAAGGTPSPPVTQTSQSGRDTNVTGVVLPPARHGGPRPKGTFASVLIRRIETQMLLEWPLPPAHGRRARYSFLIENAVFGERHSKGSCSCGLATGQRPGTAHLCLYSDAELGHKCYWSGHCHHHPRTEVRGFFNSHPSAS